MVLSMVARRCHVREHSFLVPSGFRVYRCTNRKNECRYVGVALNMTLGVALLNNFDPGSGMICFCRTNASTYVLRVIAI